MERASHVFEEVVHGVAGGALEIGVHGRRALVLGTIEDLAEDLDGALRVQTHLAPLGLAPKGDDQQDLVVDLRDVQVQGLALVEEQGELVLVEDAGELLGGGERASRQRSQGERLGVVRIGGRGDGLAGRADESQEARPRDLLELQQEVVAAVELPVVDDESLASRHARSSRSRPPATLHARGQRSIYQALPASGCARAPCIVAAAATHESLLPEPASRLRSYLQDGDAHPMNEGPCDFVTASELYDESCNLPTETLLKEGMRRLDELRRLRCELPAPAARS